MARLSLALLFLLSVLPQVLTNGGLSGAGPSLQSISPSTAAIGATVTLFGQGLGSSQGSSTVTINGVAATVTSWSVGQLILTVPSTTTGSVIVTVGGIASNALSLTVTGGTETNPIYLAAAGAGTQTGASCANAKAYTFFNSSGNWAATATVGKISPDATVHLCGTITFGANATGLTFQGSGTVGHPITLKFETGAILQAPYFSISGGGCAGAICMAGVSYVTVDGVTAGNGVIRNTANNTSSYHASELIYAVGCAHCTIQYTDQTVYAVTTQPDNTADDVLLRCIEMTGSNNVITHNRFHTAGWCVFYDYANGNDTIDISFNYFEKYAHGIMFADAGGDSVTNVFIHDNEFDAIGTIWDTAGCGRHQDGLHMFGVAASSVDNFYFYNNYFHGNYGQCPTGWVFVEAAGSGTPTNLKNSSWWNNVGIVDASSAVNTNGWFGIYSGVSGTQQVYNNTFIGTNAIDGTLCLGLQFLSGVAVYNNVMSGCQNPVYYSDITASSIDYNFYGNTALCQNGGNCFVWNGAFTGSLAAFKAACGCDSHAATNTVPKLNADGSVQASSPVISVGANLSAIGTGNLATLLSDTTKGNLRSTTARPGGATAWDMGAYNH